MSAPRSIAVTGASGYIGTRLIRRLLEKRDVERVTGVDVRHSTIRHERYTHVLQDMTAPLDDAFAGAEAVVHLAFVLRQLRDRVEGRRINVGGAESGLRACASAGVGRVVLMSSATVYGPRADNPPALTEEAPLRPPPGFAYAEDKAACEALFQAFAEQHPETCVSILRGCVVMGPNASNFITAALDKPLLIGVRGDDPEMQFVHEDDLAEVLLRFVTEPHPGVYNVAGSGSVRWSEAVSLAGKRLVRLPAPLAYGLTDLAWRARLQSDSPSAGLDFIRWPWTVSTEKLAAETGYAFRHTSREALAAYLSRAA
ncbi:MAG: NAD-dependent epimerase/dehydratase family protein [Chloroflexota bacterium]|nr:NAD-dependent epimerase/dehydratase family protein [Chloroflexota bacterium]MDE2884161.1 NAD-dependent epimerase/dehydratase family protein [Chloroflexota bacterium]